jgi:YHS domain-containing protein
MNCSRCGVDDGTASSKNTEHKIFQDIKTGKTYYLCKNCLPEFESWISGARLCKCGTMARKFEHGWKGRNFKNVVDVHRCQKNN